MRIGSKIEVQIPTSWVVYSLEKWVMHVQQVSHQSAAEAEDQKCPDLKCKIFSFCLFLDRVDRAYVPVCLIG